VIASTRTAGRDESALLGSLSKRGFDPRLVSGPEEACALAMAMIPDGALVSHGSSNTLREIGLMELLERDDRLRYGNPEWLAQSDPAARLEVRKRNSIFADVFLGSVQGIARTGQVVGCDAGGSRQAPYVWGPPKVIWVAGLNKVVDTLEDAIRRVYEVAYPLEEARRRSVTPDQGTSVNKLVIYEREPVAGRTTLILVPGRFGY
jgi:hypothetical protein